MVTFDGDVWKIEIVVMPNMNGRLLADEALKMRPGAQGALEVTAVPLTM